MLQNSGQFWDHSLFGCLFFTRYLHFESSKLFHYNFDISKRVVLRIKTNKSNPECFSSADQHPESFSGHTAAHWSSVGPLASPRTAAPLPQPHPRVTLSDSLRPLSPSFPQTPAQRWSPRSRCSFLPHPAQLVSLPAPCSLSSPEPGPKFAASGCG